jgi:thymidylate synthase ThyX
MKTSAKILCDSSIDGVRVTTFEVVFPRIVLPQLGTHRSYSKNSASSRAIPNKRIMEMVVFVPDEFPENGPGMQPKGNLRGARKFFARLTWLLALHTAKFYSLLLRLQGVHKEIANRLVEPFMYVKVLITTSEAGLANFFELRCHPDAQEQITELANCMREAYEQSIPVGRELHLPFIKESEYPSFLLYRKENIPKIMDLLHISVARCARVSYNRHDGKRASLEEDLKLFQDLVIQRPLHASPSESQVMSQRLFGWLLGLVEEWESNEKELRILLAQDRLHGNLAPGLVQYRKVLEVKAR